VKIAICLSGQPRTIEFAIKSILHYFSKNAEYDFFCHCWDYNTWKLRGDIWQEAENIEYDWLKNQLLRLNPKKYKIGTIHHLNSVTNNNNVHYGSLTYSYMIANHLKRMYEYENNFVYDYVVKARYDTIFPPDKSFNFHHPIHERTVYVPHLGRLQYEYNKLNASDCIFYGDSWGMDIASDLFRHLHRNSATFYKEDDPNIPGPGTTMYEYATNYNLNIKTVPYILPEVFYRKEAMGLDPINDFDKISEIHRSFYRDLSKI